MIFRCNAVETFYCFMLLALIVTVMTIHENQKLVDIGEVKGSMMRGLFHHELSAADRLCKQSYGHYVGQLWTKAGETLDRTCLLESSRMRVDHHSRRLPDGGKIDDWLWIEYGDRVNVLVRERSVGGGQGKFVLLKQTKYALEGSSLSVVGGFVELGETPEETALREVLEELQLKCTRHNLQALGRYRTDVNRGLGWVNAFLVQECESVITVSTESQVREDVADADSKQELQTVVRLSMAELKDAVMSGRFVEVQWTAAVTLALLHLQQ